MRDVYACSFVLDVGPGEYDRAFAATIECCLSWVAEHYSDKLSIENTTVGRWEEDADFAEWTTLSAPNGSERLWTLTYFHRDREDASLGWRTTIQLAREATELRFTLRLAIEPLRMRVAPAKFDVGRPRIVRTIADRFSGSLDDRPLRATPWLVSSREIGELVALLLSPARRLPVVVVTPEESTGRAAVDERRLADHLVGVAHVVMIRTTAASFELTAQLGKLLTVFGGAVRIYWPGLALDSDPFDHRLWMADRIATMEASGLPLQQRLMRTLSGVSVLRVPVDPLGRRLRQLTEDARRQEIAELRKRAKEAPERVLDDQFWRDYEAVLDREKEQLIRIAQLEDEIAAQQQAFGELARTYASNAGVGLLLEDDEEAPATVLEAAQVVAREYADELVFLPEAYESAGESAYPNVAKLHAALRTVGEVAREWREGALKAGFAGAFRDAGWTYAPDVSEVTVGRERSEYVRKYNGAEITLGPHLKLGSGTSAGRLARIYWWIDEENRQFVIGQVGRHLKDGTT